MSLRKKYQNKFTFGLLAHDPSFKQLTNFYSMLSVDELNKTVIELNDTLTYLGNFAGINANIKEPFFQLRSIGALMRQIFMVFGVNSPIHLNTDCTNHIISTNTTVIKECSNDTNENNCILYHFLTQSTQFDCEDLIEKKLSFTPASLFSLMQYSHKIFYAFLILNKTRINEVLFDYQLTSDLQKDYFELLEDYQGGDQLITYQDFSALAQAIYLIAPDSMLGRTFNVPYYYFIQGLYRPITDEQKLSRLILALRKAENFNYPILAQDKCNITVFNETPFTIDLLKKLKVVSLTPVPIGCYLQQPIRFPGSLEINEDCMLTGNSQSVGNFSFDLILSNNQSRLNRWIQLNVKEKNLPITTILIGRRSVEHYLSNDSEIDLAALCHAVSLPERKALSCQSFDLPDSLFLNNCSISGFNNRDNYTFNISFFNDGANKPCAIQLLSTNTILAENFTEPNSSYARYRHEDLNIDTTHTTRFIIENNYLKQCNYLLIIPLLHGALEASIDRMSVSSLLKSILKLSPRISLVAINYLSTFQLPFLFFYSLFESFVGNYLTINNNNNRRYMLNMLVFFLVAELEYGFSNLWQLVDKPRFWPTLNERLNQLFIQMLWAPTVKLTGYLLSVAMMDCYSEWMVPEKNQKAQTQVTTEEEMLGCQPSFFNSLKSAKNTVFSSRIRRLPSLFYYQFFPSFTRSANDNEIQEYEPIKSTHKSDLTI